MKNIEENFNSNFEKWGKPNTKIKLNILLMCESENSTMRLI